MLLVYIGSLVLLVVAAFFKLDGFTSKPTDELTIDNIDAGVHRRATFLAWSSAQRRWSPPAVTVRLPRHRPADRRSTSPRSPSRGRGAGLIVPCSCRCGPATWSRATPGRRCCARRASSASTQDGGVPRVGVRVHTRLRLTSPWSSRSTYLWLPYMVLPIYAGLERLPPSLLEPSGDLGAKPLRTFTSVVVPMLVPSIAAGSIFTFSLSLGDYIMPGHRHRGEGARWSATSSTARCSPRTSRSLRPTRCGRCSSSSSTSSAMRRLGAFESL